jgi:hypothetical protein
MLKAEFRLVLFARQSLENLNTYCTVKDDIQSLSAAGPHLCLVHGPDAALLQEVAIVMEKTR